MRSLLLGFVLSVGLPSTALAQGEQITMTVSIPGTTSSTIDKYVPDTLAIHVSNAANVHPTIDAVILAPDGSKLTFHYPDQTVALFDTDAEITALINQLNTANLTTTSL